MKTIHPDPPYEKPTPHPDNRFMALTSNCTDMPTLFVDTHAPLDVLEGRRKLQNPRSYPGAGEPVDARFHRV